MKKSAGKTQSKASELEEGKLKFKSTKISKVSEISKQSKNSPHTTLPAKKSADILHQETKSEKKSMGTGSTGSTKIASKALDIEPIESQEEDNETTLKPYDIINCFLDTSQSYSIYKTTLKLNHIDELQEMIAESFNLIAVYGDRNYCRLGLEQYFGKNCGKPFINEGAVFYYDESTHRGAFCYVNTNNELFLTKPIMGNNRSIFMIKILSDICPLVIDFVSDQEMSNWSDESPYKQKKFDKVKFKIETKTVEKSSLENLNRFPCTTEDSGIYLTHDLYDKFIFTKIVENQTNYSERPKLIQYFEDFVKKIFDEKYDDSSFNSVFTSLTNSIEKIIGTLKLDYTIIQSELSRLSKEYSAELKTLFKNILTDISDLFSSKLAKLAMKNPYLSDTNASRIMNEINNEFVNMRNFKKANGILEKMLKKNKLYDSLKKSLDEFFSENQKKIQEKLKSMSKDTEQYLWAAFNNFLESMTGLQLSIKIKNIIFSKSDEITHCRAEISSLSNLATIKINHTNLQVSQIISLSKESLYILLRNETDSKTHVYKLNSTSDFRIDKEMLEDFDDPDVQIAWGSILNKFFIVFKNKRQVKTGSASKGAINRGNDFPIFSPEITSIICMNYASSMRKLIFLNQLGHIYLMDAVIKESFPSLATKPRKLSEGPITDEPLQPISPADGSMYCDLQVSSDEKIFAALCRTTIDCYDMNYTIIHSIPLSEPIKHFKFYSAEFHTFVVIASEREINFWGFILPQQYTSKQTISTAKTVDATGNPCLDVWHMGVKKFGVPLEQCRLRESTSKIAALCFNEPEQIKINKYVKSLALVNKSYQYVIVKSIIDRLVFENQISKEVFFYSLLSRIPVHLASIQNGNLVPLQNGEDNFDDFTSKLENNKKFLYECVNYIKVGHLEWLLPKLRGIRVVSIIGRQSSGKSYLLNRLFGTRYDVAAQRCTEGIWMSVAFVHSSPFVIFDCEGLFSTERTSQEEMKLCLFLSAMSDVLILNSDLTSNRGFAELFDEFSLSIDRLKGSNLFKGSLEIAVRDVGDGEGSDAQNEIENFLSSQQADEKRKIILSRLFNDEYTITPYHNFENESFDEEVRESAEGYLKKEPRFETGEELLILIKTALTQIFSDDENSTDERTFEIYAENIKKLFKKVLEDPLYGKDLLEEIPFCFPFELGSQTYEIRLSVKEFSLNLKIPLIPFISAVSKLIPENVILENHNSFYKQLDLMIKNFFAAKKEMMLKFLQAKFIKYASFEKLIQVKMAHAARKVEKIAEKHYICLRNCEKCEYICVKILNHDFECTCETTHKCIFKCDICTDVPQKCSNPAGHKSRHVCAIKKHTCKKNCGVPDCPQSCVYEPNHSEMCKCSKAIHECGKSCKMNAFCKDKCRKDVLIDHEVHDCCQTRCPLKCILCDNACLSTDHMHDLKCSETVIHPKSKVPTKLHLCGNTHPCYNECTSPGICYLNLTFTVKTYTNSYNTILYRYAEQEAQKKVCAVTIPVGKYMHDGKHNCGKTIDHTCEAHCPDCSGFCNKPVNHAGLHGSKTHRNKDNCIYLSTKSTIKREIDNETGSTICKFTAGESSQPEHCESCCQRNGRGHTHPMICPGSSKCFQLTHAGYAMHSLDSYLGSKGSKSDKFDLLECSTYWRIQGWEAPLFSINPKAQEVISKCNYYCSHESHDENIFCESQLFHSISELRKDHKFPICSHTDFLSHDIVFIIDNTGSMSSCIDGVKVVIQNLIEKWKNKEDTKFGVVGYTDHNPDNGHLNGENPVIVYPSPGGNMESCSSDGALKFLSGLICGGGGGNYGEAMIDGIFAATKLKFRKIARTIFIIVADDCPHGSEFAEGTTHPKGCPCGISWRRLMSDIKVMKGKFYLVKLSTLLNNTSILFKKELNESYIETNLEGMSRFTLEVTNTISKIIHADLEFSYGARVF
ncbi:hypothetical protein SteCoe_19648 [Stentor coeruleus]|uniref:Guanylate-binding protein N-terminal domain-containing protein n=1 Tax=Stentor coeruleus TaxID=5963 RepID=A0A1R2BTS7_9CILI|nr:hypothetical protein SteCoe_19648 [Stentor coeruleus]